MFTDQELASFASELGLKDADRFLATMRGRKSRHISPPKRPGRDWSWTSAPRFYSINGVGDAAGWMRNERSSARWKPSANRGYTRHRGRRSPRAGAERLIEAWLAADRTPLPDRPARFGPARAAIEVMLTMSYQSEYARLSPTPCAAS